jgi:hypothetical protein
MPADRIREILPPDTAATWDAITQVVPPDAYLGGGTAIAVHLAHRVSRDLDFFFHNDSIDLDKLTSRLTAVGPFAVTERSAGTLNGVFSATRVQFLHADEGRSQHLLEPPGHVDGLNIAGLSDLMAMKLKVVGDRGELRDYFDLMTIEQRTGRTADEGLALFVARFQPEYPQQAINHILLGLGYFDDVDADDALPVSRDQIVDYWTRRQPEIVAARGRLSRLASRPGRRVPHVNGQRTAPACLPCRQGGLADDEAVDRHGVLGQRDRGDAKTQLARDPKAHAEEKPPDVRHRDPY